MDQNNSPTKQEENMSKRKALHLEEEKLESTTSDSGNTGESISMEVQPRSSEPKKTDMENWQKVHDAIKSGNLPELQRLIEVENIDVNIKGKMGLTPLHLAARHGRTDMVCFLADKNANMLEKNAISSTPLEVALHSKKLETASKLLEYKNVREEFADHYSEYLASIMDYSTDFISTIVQKTKEMDGVFVENRELTAVLLHRAEGLHGVGDSLHRIKKFLDIAGYNTDYIGAKIYGYNINHLIGESDDSLT